MNEFRKYKITHYFNHNTNRFGVKIYINDNYMEFESHKSFNECYKQLGIAMRAMKLD